MKGGYDNSSLVSLTSLAQEPPVAEPNTFAESTATTSTTLYVPDASLAAYKAADVWKDFFAVKGLSETGISSTTADGNAPCDIYDLQGRKLSKEPRKGAYIINGKKVVK